MAYDTETNTVVEETAAAGIGVQGNEVNAADLFAPEANGADAQQTTTQADVPAQQTEERRFTSDDMSRAVQNRLRQERRGAAYTLGRELLDEYMTANNLSEADALAKIREDRIKQKAAAFKADPEKGFAELMRQRQYTGEDARTPEARVETLYNNIVGDMKAGFLLKLSAVFFAKFSVFFANFRKFHATRRLTAFPSLKFRRQIRQIRPLWTALPQNRP